MGRELPAGECRFHRRDHGLTLLGNGPTNPRAAALVPQELRKNNPTDPENARVQVVLNGEWWGRNYQQANADFIDAVTG